jgi:hypothetical protein
MAGGAKGGNTAKGEDRSGAGRGQGAKELTI